MKRTILLEKALMSILIVMGMFFGLSTVSHAEDIYYDIDGTVMAFDSGADYAFAGAEETAGTNEKKLDTYGTFGISGNFVTMDVVEGIPVLGVKEGTFEFFYKYDDSLLKAAEDSWHLLEDSGKKIDDIKLDSKIGHGTILIQTSKDGNKWVNTGVYTNCFEETPVQNGSIHQSTEMELSKGCYYRVIVVYELGMKTGTQNIAFVKIDQSEKKKYAELYMFYAYNVDTIEEAVTDIGLKYNLGSKQRVKHDSGYSTEVDIKKDDAHYGWDIGKFFVAGYTTMIEATSSDNGNPIFLKNAGDDVTLYFNLEQDIDKLNGNDILSIAEDKNGYDKYFETAQTNMGRGTLIIRYTDPENITHDPMIYTNYLYANLSPGADTVVQICEEGDYEVALDYEIKKNPRQVLGISIIPEYYDYRIFFKFSVRSGNCMVYTFDTETRSELSNKDVTESGFYVDLANSKYLDINVKKQVLSDNGEEIVEDTRFNKPAKDGEEYTSEGIYIITAHNRYTDQDTEKIIYVGENELVKAHVKTGLTIPEIKELKKKGATIDSKGNIDTSKISDGNEEEDSNSESVENGKKDKTEEENRVVEGTKSSNPVVVVLFIVIVVLLGAVGGLLWFFKFRKGKRE